MGLNLRRFVGEEEWLRELERREAAASRHSRRLFKAIMLAPTVEVCEALIAGEAVPIDRLDPEQVRRFGLRSER